eukprot:6213968-Pleurochrysis_carterae.AAC.1
MFIFSVGLATLGSTSPSLGSVFYFMFAFGAIEASLESMPWIRSRTELCPAANYLTPRFRWLQDV